MVRVSINLWNIEPSEYRPITVFNLLYTSCYYSSSTDDFCSRCDGVDTVLPSSAYFIKLHLLLYACSISVHLDVYVVCDVIVFMCFKHSCYRISAGLFINAIPFSVYICS